jgi:hypothetical protein
MAPPSVHSLVMDKGNETVKVEHQDMTTLPVDHRPEILRQYSVEELREIEKKLVRRLDFRCLPILIFLFLLNILDRNAIANARLGGLEADLGMDDGQYQNVSWIHFWIVPRMPLCF